MALSPNDFGIACMIVEKLVEERLDAEITAKERTAYTSIFICVDFKVPTSVREAIQAKYLAANWGTVTFTSSEGGYLHIELQRKTVLSHIMSDPSRR